MRGKMLTPVLGLLVAMSLAGCSHPEFDRMQADAVTRTQNLSIVCTEGADCAAKWSRALQWVTQNAPYKLRIATDSVITTEGPLSDSFYSAQSAITVNRVSRGDGTSEIVFNSGCANQFGCVPTHEMLLSNFTDFVGGTEPVQAQRGRFGVHYAALDARMIAILHMQEDHGLLVGGVDDNSPAAKAGIQRADVILAFAGRPMSSITDLQGALTAVSTGASIPVRIWRGGQELDVAVQF